MVGIATAYRQYFYVYGDFLYIKNGGKKRKNKKYFSEYKVMRQLMVVSHSAEEIYFSFFGYSILFFVSSYRTDT